MQTLQPMHSRMSSSRPSSIFRGRNGSAIDGRAAPIISRMPRRICDTMASGEVNRDGAAVADGLFRVLDQLAQQPCAILQAAAILVAALIPALLQEMHRQ